MSLALSATTRIGHVPEAWPFNSFHFIARRKSRVPIAVAHTTPTVQQLAGPRIVEDSERSDGVHRQKTLISVPSMTAPRFDGVSTLKVRRSHMGRIIALQSMPAPLLLPFVVPPGQ